jgi:hypothetical protein
VGIAGNFDALVVTEVRRIIGREGLSTQQLTSTTLHVRTGAHRAESFSSWSGVFGHQGKCFSFLLLCFYQTFQFRNRCSVATMIRYNYTTTLPSKVKSRLENIFICYHRHIQELLIGLQSIWFAKHFVQASQTE